MKTLLLILLVTSLPFCAAAQRYVFPEDWPAYSYFDSLIQKNIKRYPTKSLYHIINRSYTELNQRPNKAVDSMDRRAQTIRVSTHSMMGTVAVNYVWHSLYDSLLRNDSFERLRPAADLYNSYLCNCVNFDFFRESQVQKPAALRVRLDSCKQSFRLSREWDAYQKTIDSIGTARPKNIDPHTLVAYFIKTCLGIRKMVWLDLPYQSGNSPAEQLLIKTNRLHREIINAVLVNPVYAKPYTSVKTFDTFSRLVKNIQQAGLVSPLTTRMTFYHNDGNFFFLKLNAAGELKIVSRLSYTFHFIEGAFRVANVAYQVRKDMEPKWLNDRYVFDHYFRYPMIAVTDYGLPLNAEIPKEEKITSKFEEVLGQFDLMPPTD